MTCPYFVHVNNDEIHSHYCTHPISQTGRCGFKLNEIDHVNCVCRLRIVEIPADAHWIIDEYDGLETVYWSMSEVYTD